MHAWPERKHFTPQQCNSSSNSSPPSECNSAPFGVHTRQTAAKARRARDVRFEVLRVRFCPSLSLCVIALLKMQHPPRAQRASLSQGPACMGVHSARECVARSTVLDSNPLFSRPGGGVCGFLSLYPRLHHVSLPPPARLSTDFATPLGVDSGTTSLHPPLDHSCTLYVTQRRSVLALDHPSLDEQV